MRALFCAVRPGISGISGISCILGWLVVTLLGACSHLEPERPVTGLSQSSPSLSSPQLPAHLPTHLPGYQASIDLQGRMSVQYQQRGKDEAVHGKFEWHQQPNEITITLRSPLGETLAQISVTPEGARLTQAGVPERQAADIDTLMAQTLGWPLPVAGLRFWLQGHVPGAPPLQDGVAESQGWRIRFVSWHANGSPKRIDLERYGTEAGEVRLRLIIDGPV